MCASRDRSSDRIWNCRSVDPDQERSAGRYIGLTARFRPDLLPPLSVIFGLVGVLVGVAIASGYSYWSIRRSELEQALVSATIMCDEMRALIVEMGRSSAAGSSQLARTASTWDERR